MKKKVYIASDNIVSPLGFTTAQNFENLLKDESGITLHSDSKKSTIPFRAALLDNELLENAFNRWEEKEDFTRLEKMLLISIREALSRTSIDIQSPKTLIVLSSAKGNVDLLEENGSFDPSRVYLSGLARVVQKFFANPNMPVVVSNGCISGALALLIAKRSLASGRFDHVVVSGGDIISEFTLSGFQSFKALSDSSCKPFDKDRNGLNLGEGSGTIILTVDREAVDEKLVEFVSGGISNDANHISGPSRTGEGLVLALKHTLQNTDVKSRDIGYISAHGTATVYNDEMESIAFASMEMDSVPVNSLKGYFGHTLGAAGVIETVVALQSLKENYLLKTKGFSHRGVSGAINVIERTEKKNFSSCIKTASGFGGCNAALLFSRL